MINGDISDRIVYSGGDIIIFDKNPGEDSEKIPELLGGGFNVLTRLDKPVAGLLPLLRTTGDKTRYCFEKTYLAVVCGDPGESGLMEDLLFHDKRANKTYVVKRMRKGVKSAGLEYERLAYDQEHDLSLVKIRLMTGRTHQIRVQFGSRHMPLAGDGKYGSRIKCENVALIAHEIVLKDLKEGTSTRIVSKIPDIYPWNLYQ